MGLWTCLVCVVNYDLAIYADYQFWRIGGKEVNKVILMGRLTRDVEVRYGSGENATAVARYTLAVDRRIRREGEATADFINCVAFGKAAEFAEKYFRQGLKIVITGRIQTGSYTNRDGQKVYTTDVVVEEQEFAESKSASETSTAASTGSNYNNQGSYGGNARSTTPQRNEPQYQQQSMVGKDGFMNIPDGIDEELPFN